MSTIDDLFTYHPPNERTSPKYAMVRAAEDHLRDRLRSVVDFSNSLDRQMRHTLTSDACRAFYEAIETVAPASADKTTALRLIRLVRMRINESLVTGVEVDVSALIRDARMWTCAAIAIADAQLAAALPINAALDARDAADVADAAARGVVKP